MGRSRENAGFRCVVCATAVRPLTNGSYRNHCPSCLSSLHIDVQMGDRANRCGGLMDATAIRKRKKGWQIVHRCRRCGAERSNIVAVDTDQQDDLDVILQVMIDSGPRP